MLVANDPNNNPIELQADSNGNLKTSIVGSLANLIASNVTVLAGATWRPTNVTNLNGKQSGAYFIKITQNYNLSVKPYFTSDGADANALDISIVTGQGALPGNYRNHDVSTAIKQCLYCKPTVVNAGASDATLTLWEVIK